MSILKRDPPYAGTTVPPETTWAQVENLLLDYGAEAVREGKAPTIGGFDHYVPALPEKKEGRKVIDIERSP